MNTKLASKIINFKGFTLVELLISVGIILMITAFTLPGFSQYTKRKNFDRAVETFAVAVQNTRARAVAGARHPDNTIAAESGDLWGIVLWCSPDTSHPLIPGLYFQVYTRASGKLEEFPNSGNYIKWSNLNPNLHTGTELKYRFQCSTPGYDNQYIYFNKFTGLGATTTDPNAESGFNYGDSITVRVVDDSMGFSKSVVIYKTGIVDVL